MKYPKELLQMERLAFSITKAMPELRALYDSFDGPCPELFAAIEEIETRFGIAG